MTIDNGLIEEIRRLRGEGLTISAISKALGISRPTVYKVLNESEAPEGSHEIKHKGSLVSKPHLRAIPVENPSNQLKRVREETEATLLEVDRAKALKELEALTRRPPLSLEEKRALLEETKIDLELKRLRSEELDEERKERERKVIEKVKDQALPRPLREELPPDVVYRTLSRIHDELTRVNVLTTGEDELLALAKLARDSVLCEVDRGVITSAVNRSVRKELIRYLHQVSGGRIDQLLEWMARELVEKDPEVLKDLFRSLGEFIGAFGGKDEANLISSKLTKIFGGQGGDANGKGLPV